MIKFTQIRIIFYVFILNILVKIDYDFYYSL